jgi:hypothetical protein
MWEISSASADRLFALSNVVLIAGAAAVLIGTMGSIVFGTVREQFSNGRMAANERATAEANARAASLEKEGAGLRLALEAAKAETLRIAQGISSRHVLAAQRALIVSTVRGSELKLAVVNWSLGEPEVLSYRDELADAFKSAGAVVEVGQNTISPAQVGLLVLDATDRAQSLVAHALDAAGIEYAFQREDILQPIIRVGIKKPAL